MAGLQQAVEFRSQLSGPGRVVRQLRTGGTRRRLVRARDQALAARSVASDAAPAVTPG